MPPIVGHRLTSEAAKFATIYFSNRKVSHLSASVRSVSKALNFIGFVQGYTPLQSRRGTNLFAGSLSNRELIVCKRKEWFITAQGYDALGLPCKGPVTKQAIETVVKEATTSSSREKSKQAQVIAMLKSPEGATLKRICEATDWQQHTVRDAFAGAFKKKLGLKITSAKATGGYRVYRID